MKKSLSILYLILLFSSSSIYCLCHSCSAWLTENKPGKTRTTVIKACCCIKRFITRRRCCCCNCYKNNPNYRVQVKRNIKDRFANGMMRCDKCGQHHICHVCGKKQCLVNCNDHDVNKEVIIIPNNRVSANRVKELDKK